jgi:myo-inositol-1(or 4)-monophosphatase
MQPLLNIAIQAARRAGETIVRGLNRVHQLDVRAKGQNDFVSEIDTLAEREIIDTVHRRYPQHDFLAEESGQSGQDSEFLWIIDPLDGTTNFLHGLPQFAISVGLERDGTIVAGVIYDPAKDELFIAERGKGAYLNNRRIRVAARGDLADAVVANGLPHIGKGDHGLYLREAASVMAYVGGMRRWGAASLDLAYVACGRFDAYWERGLNSWDIAAGILLIREAGGFVSDADGGSDPLAKGSIACGNEIMHRELLKLLKKAKG